MEIRAILFKVLSLTLQGGVVLIQKRVENPFAAMKMLCKGVCVNELKTHARSILPSHYTGKERKDRFTGKIGNHGEIGHERIE
jgi:hypothetical protein